MKIASQLAQKIVDTIKTTLNYNVNFMNTKGIIIASTDINRIDTFHEGSTICFKKQAPLFIESDVQYIGSRRGINSPVFFDGKIIGIIGMSGDKEVLKFTELLRTMTEILVKESFLNEITFQKRERNRLIINSLVFGLGNKDVEYFSTDESSSYRVIYGFTPKENQHSTIESIIDFPFTIDQRNVTIIMPQNDKTPNLLKQLAEKTGMIIGVGFETSNIKQLHESYLAAKKSLRWLNKSISSNKILYFEDLDLGLILSDIEPVNVNLFIKSIFKDIKKEQLDNLYEIFKSFAKHNGSIKSISEELFIHKNTIQYQLNKLKKLTGYDARVYNDFSILNLAFTLYYDN